MRHLDDAELVRYVDGEHDPAHAARWREHVASCDRCHAEAAVIRSQSGLVSGWLDRAAFEADLPDRPDLTDLAGLRGLRSDGGEAALPLAGATRRDGTPGRGRAAGVGVPVASTAWLRAAVIVLLLAAPLAAFPSLRVWVMDQVGRAVGPAAIEDTRATRPDAGPLVRFTPDAGGFTVRVESTAAGATLRLERADGAEATLRLAGAAEPVVSAGALRIRGGEPGAAHRLALPAAVTGVVVVVGQRVIRVTADELDEGRTLDLDGRGGG